MVEIEYIKTMARSNLNYLMRCKAIQQITQMALNKYGDIKYSAIWRNVIYPIYYLSYPYYIKAINETNLNKRIKEKEKEVTEKQKKHKRLAEKDKFYFALDFIKQSGIF